MNTTRLPKTRYTYPKTSTLLLTGLSSSLSLLLGCDGLLWPAFSDEAICEQLYGDQVLELCDGIDNDCDGEVDEGFSRAYQDRFEDADGDGYGVALPSCETAAVAPPDPSFTETYRGDCDDDDNTVYPTADDTLGDNKDSDCGGSDGPDPYVWESQCGAAENCFSSIAEAVDSLRDALKAGPYAVGKAGITIWVGKATDKNAQIALDLDIPVRIIGISLREQVSLNNISFWIKGNAPVLLDGLTLKGELYQKDNPPSPIHIQTSISTCKLDASVPDSGPSVTLLNLNVLGDKGMTYSPALTVESGAVMLGYVTLEKHSVGIMMTNGCLDCFNCTIRENVEVPERGNLGGVFAEAVADVGTCEVRFHSSDISYNESNSNGGGGVSLKNCKATLENSSITGNQAKGEFSSLAGGLHLVENAEAILLNTVMTHNELVLKNEIIAGGSAILLHNSTLRMGRSIIAYNLMTRDGELACETASVVVVDDEKDVQVEAEHNLLYDVCGVELCTATVNRSGCDELLELEGNNVFADPKFLHAESADGPDLHLSTASPARDSDRDELPFIDEDGVKGLGTITDLDGSAPDMGIYGGPFGGYRDLDRDGYFDYFWPGSCSDVPTGIDLAAWDCHDRDGGTH